MDIPYFIVTKYSAFDSGMWKHKMSTETSRLASAYEFEFYTEDCLGGPVIDGVHYQAKRGYFSCTKPGQMLQTIVPYKCYFFNIFTQDPILQEALNNLPDFSILWEMEEVVRLFHEMLTVESTDRPENRIYVDGCIFRIIGLLSRDRGPAWSQADENARLHRKLLQNADRYIREHYAEDLSLAALAERYGLHPNYFHKLYTDAFGKTPAQKLLACRIAAAKMALITGNKSMAEIAAECGFSSQTYFGYKFKQATGRTPLQYRKRVLGTRKV